MNIPSFDPERNYLVYILDILEATDLIKKYCHGMDEITFSQNTLIQDAVVRRFQIIGEAAGHMPKEIRGRFPEIPWKQIVAFRNLIIHDYAKIKQGKVWEIIQTELPKLKSQLQVVKEKLE